LITIERLSDGGFFKNNRQMIVRSWWPSIPRFDQVIRSMTRLEKLSILEWKLTLTNVPQLLRSCPNLNELRFKLVERSNVKMSEDLKNELRQSFEKQRLKIFELDMNSTDMDSWLVIQEMFT
jgi:hypothetical protein